MYNCYVFSKYSPLTVDGMAMEISRMAPSHFLRKKPYKCWDTVSQLCRLRLTAMTRCRRSSHLKNTFYSLRAGCLLGISKLHYLGRFWNQNACLQGPFSTLQRARNRMEQDQASRVGDLARQLSFYPTQTLRVQ